MVSERATTMADVARRANVSQATVSYVLNNDPKHSIPEKTRRLVLDAARDLDYRPNHAARDLVLGRRSVVVCIVPPIPLSEPVISLIGELTTAFAAEGIVMAVHFERAGDASLPAMRDALKPRATFSLFPSSGNEVEGGLGLGDSPADPGSRLQVEHLAGLGHTRLAFAGSAEPELRSQSDERGRAVARYVSECGLPAVDARLIRADAVGAVDTVRAWRDAGVTAICANNDEVALAVLRGIRSGGLRCPDDLSVIGYDATTAGTLSDPPLSSIGWRSRALGPIVRSILQQTTPAPDDLAHAIEAWLVERGSVGRPG